MKPAPESHPCCRVRRFALIDTRTDSKSYLSY